jgi:GNAT superfamily N-acetyltransferase
MNVRMRRATMDDAGSIAELSSELGYPASGDVMRKRLERILGRDDHLVLLAVVDDGTVGGWIQAHAAGFLESGLRVDIVGLVVATSLRRNGIGRLLVHEIEQWADRVGADLIGVRSNIQRAESHLFYPALGYAAVKTQVAYRKRLNE